MKKIVSIILILTSIVSILLFTKNVFDREFSENIVENIRITREQNQEIKEQTDYNKFTYNQEEEKLKTNNSIKFDIQANSDKLLIESIENYVGWILINDTKIDYPIVKTDNNTFYLNHTYDLSENVAGSIFMDRRNLGNPFDNHTIIYGHYMKDGTMFTDLNRYLEEDFYYSNPIISISDLYNNYRYEVFSAYYVTADEFILSFELSEMTINYFINNSLFTTDYAYTENDRILTLSTCNYILTNGRMILHAVLIDE